MENEIKAQGSIQLKRINDMATELINEGHSHADEIRRRQKNANRLWEHLLGMRKSKERNVVSACLYFISILVIFFLGGGFLVLHDELLTVFF